jgi:hypothetical protein
MPLTFHVTAVLAVKFLVLLMRTDALVGEMLTVIAAGGGVTVITAVPTAEDCARLVACIVTGPGGTLAGAV